MSFSKSRTTKMRVKKKQSVYGSGEALRAPGDWGSQNFKIICTWRGQGFQPYTPAAFTSPEYIPGTHFCHRLSQPQGHSAARRIKSIKTPGKTSKIDPATSRLVAHCLNQLRHRAPLQKSRLTLNTFCQYSLVKPFAWYDKNGDVGTKNI
jgi:hypothetical protein